MGLPVGACQRGQRFRSDERRISRHHDYKFGAADRAPRDQQSMPGAALRLLHHRAHAQRFKHRGDLLGLMSYDAHHGARF